MSWKPSEHRLTSWAFRQACCTVSVHHVFSLFTLDFIFLWLLYVKWWKGVLNFEVSFCLAPYQASCQLAGVCNLSYSPWYRKGSEVLRDTWEKTKMALFIRQIWCGSGGGVILYLLFWFWTENTWLKSNKPTLFLLVKALKKQDCKQ